MSFISQKSTTGIYNLHEKINVYLFYLELPWGEPSNKDKEYKLWKSKYYINHSPWTKLEPTILSLVRRMLTPSPAKRYNMIEIKSHYWFKLENRGIFLFLFIYF